MEEKILTTLIAGGVSLIISLIGFISTRMSLQGKKREIEIQIDNIYMQKLYEERLAHYPTALDATKYLTRVPKNNNSFDRQSVLKIRSQISDWMNGPGGLIASRQLIESGYKLRDCLSSNYEYNNRYSKPQMDKIVNITSQFRRNLRKDIEFYHDTDIRGIS
ncbi:hypothetical protein [Pseudoteredinibacter isoporae]|uniref:Uncharacterized protein n=1 Tax=Pseudoteredinibacter isoporae TaxID=570281 RepID=A0A7X0JSN8_9GAMM|nr:hypothetical protein [Pseudoteredinibacter isoporae]MBB6521144.1 hypothetical protein [Pseudoteredinibacter isoporae]NHO86705.1 hypothetical protein [Pseudoteredinibacter isoporae]NIB24843.1 hypothetical protein [Pseudoteredinibacter isoporae]